MFVASYAAVPVALVAARDSSAHVAMSITDPTASSCSITKGLAARTETAASDPADCRAASEPGAADSDGGAAKGSNVCGADVLLVGKGVVCVSLTLRETATTVDVPVRKSSEDSSSVTDCCLCCCLVPIIEAVDDGKTNVLTAARVGTDVDALRAPLCRFVCLVVTEYGKECNENEGDCGSIFVSVGDNVRLSLRDDGAVAVCVSAMRYAVREEDGDCMPIAVTVEVRVRLCAAAVMVLGAGCDAVGGNLYVRVSSNMLAVGFKRSDSVVVTVFSLILVCVSRAVCPRDAVRWRDTESVGVCSAQGPG